jgi:hypothetical protein
VLSWVHVTARGVRDPAMDRQRTAHIRHVGRVCRNRGPIARSPEQRSAGTASRRVRRRLIDLQPTRAYRVSA